MTDAQMGRCRKRLEQFLVDLLEPLGRSERRHWGSVYVRGLLLDGERKSIEPMSKRLPDGNEQAMQQLVGQSRWGMATGVGAISAANGEGTGARCDLGDR